MQMDGSPSQWTRVRKLRDGDGQGILACYSPWGHEESDKTEQLNNNKADIFTYLLTYL